ncbi:hypothetical protein AB0J21_20865 [Streptomyces sp. NPDC049954]|uniref:hypothetical protein n=1 Tax=Streptomyces sp. NPDC049954 TaxID=3155779 RepID=UPI00341FB309
MGSFDVGIEFSYGWCTLRLTDGVESVEIRNHWLNDGFPELVDSVNLLLEGRRSVSCRWQREVAGGHFVDLVSDPHGGLSVVVHAFHQDEPGDAAQVWSAERGSVVFRAHVPFNEFVLRFAAALRVVRTLSTDPAGMIGHWGYPFPQTAFELLERRAVRLGYKPRARPEIEEERDGG